MFQKPHYVRDYEKFVNNLMRNFSLEEAMSQAVGGAYEETGQIERRILEHAGLQPGMSLVDVGCGSGRLATALSDMDLDYLGLDVVQKLLDYAQKRANSRFRFVRHTRLTIPKPDSSVDMCCAFSVFTHLRHEESFLYLGDAHRALRPGGTFVFSFLEFATDHHWPAFAATAEAVRGGALPYLNVFTERTMWRVFAEKIGYELVEFVEGAEAPWGGAPLGQCTAFLRKI